MTWNIFKRIAQLEQWVKDLRDFIFENSRRIKQLEDKMRQVENKLFIQAVEHKAFSASHSEGEPVFARDKVDEELLKKRQYQREWYAKKRAKAKQEKNAQAAREKKNAYHRAYYARKKAEAK
jgi:uncharacterized coiled-coil protein SlyX